MALLFVRVSKVVNYLISIDILLYFFHFLKPKVIDKADNNITSTMILVIKCLYEKFLYISTRNVGSKTPNGKEIVIIQ